MSSDLQTPFDVGIVMATVARPTMAEAVRSVFAQRFGGRIQVLIGIDRWLGDRALVEQLRVGGDVDGLWARALEVLAAYTGGGDTGDGGDGHGAPAGAVHPDAVGRRTNSFWRR